MSPLVERARAVASGVAAENAMAVDAQGRFPAETFAALRDAQLLGAFVPRAFGGEGASISEIASICHLLGRNCSSAGLIYAMHQIQIACIVRHGLISAWHRDMLRHITSDQLLLASATTEAATGGDLGRSECAVTTNGTHFSLRKLGTVISYANQADVILATARRSPDAPGSDQVLAVIPRQHFELTQTGTWDTLGMRGTGSNTYVFDAEGHVDQILPVPYGDVQNDTMTPYAHLTWAAVWLGIAADALSRARRYLRSKPDAAISQARLVDANAVLQQLKASVAAALQQYESLLASNGQAASMSLLMTMNNLKLSVSMGVIDIIQRALLICGISGYRNDSPFSLGRHLRDAWSAALMVSNDRITAGMGKMLLVLNANADLLPGETP